MTQIIITKSQCGLPSLKAIMENGSEKLLHSSYDPAREARELVRRWDFNGRGIIVALGLGLGYQVTELASRFPETEIIIIEALSECESIAREQGMVDLGNGRLTCLSGLNPETAIRVITERQLKAGIQPLALFTLPSALAAFPDYYRPLVETLTVSIKLNLPEKLRYPKFKDYTARVLLLDCNYFLTRELDSALRQLDQQVEKIHFRKDTPVNVLIAKLISSIATFRPDFCLTVNHLGFDQAGEVSQFLRSIEIPSASWFVDSPDLILRGFAGNASPLVSVFVWDSSYINSMNKFGFESVNYLPLATDPEVFRPFSPGKSKVARMATTVGFVGNSMIPRLNDWLAKVNPNLYAIVNKTAILLSQARTGLDEIYSLLDPEERQQVETLDGQKRLDFESAATWQATLFYRLECIERLEDFKPVIHGDLGWQTLLNGNFVIEPPLDYYQELPFFYNACKINFNATHLQMGKAVNQRVFDVPACSGFLITDHQESLEKLFTVGTEIVTYKCPEEIPGLVRFYLDNRVARERVSRMGRERVLREHTYRHRVTTILDTMKTRYSVLL